MAADALERVTNLLALLLESRVPLTLDEIASELGDLYPGGAGARRAMFERDKLLLRSAGVPIDTEVLGGDQAGQTAYRIDRRRYELDLQLDDDERRALSVALAAVRFAGDSAGLSGDGVGADLGGPAGDLGGPGGAGGPAGPGGSGDVGGWSGETALWKVGADPADDDGWSGVLEASLPALRGLADLHAAVAARTSVTFGYRGRERRLDPWGLLSREGFWYVVGFDHGAGEQRTYRVDRIEDGVEAAGPAEHARPEGFDVRRAFPADAKQMGGGSATALVAIDQVRARAAARELGDDAVHERRADGSVVVRVPCANPLAFRSWVLGFAEHAEVLEPPEQRAAIVDWLRATVGA